MVMATVHFTARLGALVPAKQARVDGATVRDVLKHIFAQNAQLKGYVLDEQGRLRKHVCVFLDGERLAHDAALATCVGPQSEIYVMQALSGG
ncbi:MAG TPA: MoaD/ThiS family protein [Rhizomicrobium sp.]|nr:MoaD/ThiS family protein [Rhizomicrobium sp.]